MESFAEWGYVGLFLASFLAATIIPLGSEIVLSIMIASNYDLTLSLFIASVGNWTGGLSSYGIGRIGNWNFIERYFKISRQKIESLKIKIDDWGSLLAFFCWLPIIGDPIAISLGFFRTNFIKVSFWMFMGKLIRYLIWAMITYWTISIF
jgi:membrane protein YqaA with SNARE-associated domain|tara:strand:- start:83 stop:532 length:450 start_codon:yes stop_codon:yes gene_type:complete